MTPNLTPEGYAQTRSKLANLRSRLADLEARTDLKPDYRSEVRKSYEGMIRDYLREIKLFEAAHPAESGSTPI